jgi:predicted nucleic acid-binding protein
MANLVKARALAGLDLCRDSGRHSFADALLWAQALDSHADRIYSLDRKFPARGLRIVDRRQSDPSRGAASLGLPPKI